MSSRLPLLYCDDDLVVVTKPSGCSSHRHRVDEPEDARELAARVANIPYEMLWPVHRLDACTSGVMIFGRSKAIARHLCNLWRRRRIHKGYLAIVTGKPKARRFVVSIPLHATSRRTWPDRDRGKPCTTIVRSLVHGRNRTLVSCHPWEGRKHQIRAHLAFAGHPLEGDQLYGCSSSSGPYLHAHWLRIPTKSSFRRHLFVAPRPSDLEFRIDELFRHGKDNLHEVSQVDDPIPPLHDGDDSSR